MLKIFFCPNLLAMVMGFCCLISSIECSLDIPFLGCWELQCPTSKSLSLSHTEGKGLGYKQGYSSLDLFLAQPICEGQVIPFADLRGHVFNNGRFAANAGLGLRWLNPYYCQVWGINCFYDSFITSRVPYHQVAFGLEALGETWDVRVNGYLPVGHKKTQIYRLSYNIFPGFLAKASEQFAMGGFDAEIGYHFCKMQYVDLYAGLGPYFYWGSSRKTKNAFRVIDKDLAGGRLRVSAVFLSYCELEGIAAYDFRFKWNGQVTFSLNIPFDWVFCFMNQVEICAPCALKERLFQPVIRNEIIVIDRINRFSANPAILDPEFEP